MSIDLFNSQIKHSLFFYTCQGVKLKMHSNLFKVKMLVSGATDILKLFLLKIKSEELLIQSTSIY